MSKFDAVIIGGGHNGLVCASYLSKKGYKTLILEKNEKLGGLANYGSSLNGMSSKVLQELQIHLPQLTTKSYVVALDDEQQHTIIHNDGSKTSFHATNASIENQKKFIALIDKYKLYSSTLSTHLCMIHPLD